MWDKILFWGVLVWMIGMLVFAVAAVREIWRESSQSPAEPAPPEPAPPPPETAGPNHGRDAS